MIATVAVTLGGNCNNCGSYDLSLIGPEPSVPVLAPPLRVAWSAAPAQVA